MSRLLLVLTGLCATSSAIAAQQTENARPTPCDPYGKQAVSIRGRIVEDSTGRPVGTRGVFLVGADCFTATDTAGEFTFHGVPPGAYRVGIAPLGYRRHPPVPVVVEPGSVTDVGTIRLRPENLVADCMENEGCAALLRPDPASVVPLDEDERLREAVLRMSIALGRGDGNAAQAWIPCAPDTEPAVFTALERRIPELAPDSACALPPSASLRPDASLKHRRSGRPAFSVRVARIERDGETAVSRSSYYVGPLHAEGWVCSLKQESQGWVPQWCRMEWIS